MDGRRQQAQRLDQWLETGRQLVDGVAGTRPGRRPGSRSGRTAADSLDAVGRWVGDKIDWLLDEEDDGGDSWREPPAQPLRSAQPFRSEQPLRSNGRKRPLEAISRRQPPLIPPAVQAREPSVADDEWPDESEFRVERWKRGVATESAGVPEGVSVRRPGSAAAESPVRRSLPRSSRRRDG